VNRPAAIWTAFALQGRWKNFVLAAQLALQFCLIWVCFAVAKTKPDVVVVGADGSSTYVDAAVAPEALRDFLRTHQGKPSDIAVTAFVERFLKLTQAIHSATVADAWTEALTLMAPGLADKMQVEAASQKAIEAYQLMGVRMDIRIDSIALIERQGDKAQIRVGVHRSKRRLASPTTVEEESYQVDLVLHETPRSRQRPDGLEVLLFSVGPVAATAQPLPSQPGVTP
jgi:hypothetical protein